MARNKINKIKIENPFERIVTVIDNNEYSYNELDIEEDLDIVKERLSTSKRLSFEVAQTSSNKTSTSDKVGYKVPKLIEQLPGEIKHHHYYIT